MPIRVLVVDDSALIRRLLTELLRSDPDIEVVGAAPDPYVAREQIKTHNPDVITLDIEMPRMDGLSFLERLMALRPTPVLVVSTLTQQGAEAVLRALELGAVDTVGKPLAGVHDGLMAMRDELIAKVKAAATSRPRPPSARPSSACAPSARQADARPLSADPRLSPAGRIVAIGASTGGVEALREVLVAMPADAPAILVTQHMPPNFTTSFARRLDECCNVAVAEASDGRSVQPGQVYIANGRYHLELVRSGGHYRCRVQDGAPVSGHRPSVDVLFASVAAAAGGRAVGVILTGMGHDGAAGLLAMRRAGARTLGQDEASCLIYGMPKQAKLLGAVETELPLSRMAPAILDACRATR